MYFFTSKEFKIYDFLLFFRHDWAGQTRSSTFYATNWNFLWSFTFFIFFEIKNNILNDFFVIFHQERKKSTFFEDFILVLHIFWFVKWHLWTIFWSFNVKNSYFWWLFSIFHIFQKQNEIFVRFFFILHQKCHKWIFFENFFCFSCFLLCRIAILNNFFQEFMPRIQIF